MNNCGADIINRLTAFFDTTNYYTYIATKTESELADRGHNKSGKHHLRQVGFGLLLDHASSLPLYYTAYPGNLHDLKIFHQVLDEMFVAMMGFAEGGKRANGCLR